MNSSVYILYVHLVDLIWRKQRMQNINYQRELEKLLDMFENSKGLDPFALFEGFSTV